MEELRGYDAWKTNVPEPDEVVAGQCPTCNTEMLHGDEIYRDGEDGSDFCSKECYKVHIKKHLDDFLDRFIELAEEAGDCGTAFIEVEIEEPDFD